MKDNIKDSSGDDESSSAPNTSKISCNEILTNSEIGHPDSSSTTLTNLSINMSNKFKFANYTPGELFNHSRQNSNLFSYRNSEKYRMNFKGILMDSSEKHEDSALVR